MNTKYVFYDVFNDYYVTINIHFLLSVIGSTIGRNLKIIIREEDFKLNDRNCRNIYSLSQVKKLINKINKYNLHDNKEIQFLQIIPIITDISYKQVLDITNAIKFRDICIKGGEEFLRR